jgi:hypothetical protein
MNNSKYIGWKIYIFTILCFFIEGSLTAQTFFGQPYKHVHDEKCAAHLMEALQEEKLGIYGSKEYFEAWMETKIADQRKNPAKYRTQSGPRVIPVVVHVIHNGTEVGVGANIPTAQILRQIRILTEDFRRQNPDANKTPTEFLGVAGDSNIEFVLAKQDPRGVPTTGINRVKGPKTSYNFQDSQILSDIAYWPAEDYLNIWVAPLASPLIGFASFPVSELPGLAFPANPREVDGVTVDYRYFGAGGNAVSGSVGRTATHEVGHYLGLRHIWGDGDCTVDDFVDDTPRQNSANNICRTNNPRFSCDTRDMTENYMDYSPDACMNLFTKGQIERMDVVLELSPRRASLVNGRATREPQLINNDLGIENIINPKAFICEESLTPIIDVFNGGNNVINSAVLEISLNNVVLERKTFSLNLQLGQNQSLSFNPITIPNNTSLFKVKVISVNNQEDLNTNNNEIQTQPKLQQQVLAPYAFKFTDLNNSWYIDNKDDEITWDVFPAIIDGSPQELLRLRHYEYETLGASDLLISPKINLSQFPNAQLTFDIAHAPFDNTSFSDNLIIAVSTDCGNTFNTINAPYNKNRTFLQTVAPRESEFIPNSQSQFRREIVNLKQFAGQEIVLAFIAINGYGNNIYIKNIEILPQETYNYNVKINELISPRPITNGTQEQEIISLTNTGNLNLTGFFFRRKSSTGLNQNFLARGLSIAPGETLNVSLPNSITSEGKVTMDYELTFPNFDQNPRNKIEISRVVQVNRERMSTPWRQNFNNKTELTPWISINPENDQNSWRLIPLQTGASGNNAVVLDNSTPNQSHWLGSPIFDLSMSSQASLFFDFAAGNVTERTTLKVLASQNGGATYQEVFSKSGNALKTISGPMANPNTSQDYVRAYVNLTNFAGKGKKDIRIAFVLEGADANTSPIYLNNVELFLSANPEPVDPGLDKTIIYPVPAREFFNIAFNLSDFENVNIKIYSTTGALVHDVEYPRTLNQTYTLSSSLFSKGLFIVKIESKTISETRKIIIE